MDLLPTIGPRQGSLFIHRFKASRQDSHSIGMRMRVQYDFSYHGSCITDPPWRKTKAVQSLDVVPFNSRRHIGAILL